MKSFTQKGICKKIIIAFLTFVLLFQFMMPIRSEADFELPTADEVFTGMAQILAAGGDLVMGALNNFMLGTKGFGTAMISSEALENNTGSWFEPKDDNGNEVTANEPGDFEDIEVEGDPESKKVIVYVEDGTITEGAVLADSDYWEVPNLLYCPENIFGNNIAMLDVNFLNPNQYSAAVESNLDDEGNEQSRGVETAKDRNGKDSSIAHQLQQTIGTWYKAFRNIAVVALLSILVYLGIRILISSTADDKAKYKETIKDWLIALVLIFAMHIIMSFVIMIVNQINSLFININNSIYVWYEGKVAFRSNFTGVMRFLAQSNDLGNAWAYTIIYLILVAYTVSFTFQYLKRVLYIAFYTMIAPLVAITYPLDKLGDGKSQAFNKWLREYVMTMALQPIHLIIYTMVVSSAMTLSIKSPLYAIVAIGFLIPAEQFIKSLFGIESKADSGFAAGAATTAVAMNALGKMRKPIGPRNSGGGKVKKIGGSDGIDESEDKAPVIRQSGNKELESFNKSYNTDTDDKGYNSQYEVGSNERFNLQNKDGYTYIDGDENREPINFSMGDSNGYWTQDGANSTPLGSDGNAGDSEDMEENYNLDMKDLNDIEAGEDEEGMYLDDGNYDMDNPVEILDDDSQDESNLRTNDIVDLDEVEPEDGQDRIETQDIVDLDDEKTGFKDNLKGTEPEEFEVKPEEKPIISGYTSPTASNSNSKQQEGAEENTNTAEPVKFTRSLTEPEYEQEPEEDIGKNANENMYTAEPVTFTSGLGNTENKEDSNNTHEDNNEIYSVDYSKPQQPDNKPQKTPEQIQKEKEKEEKERKKAIKKAVNKKYRGRVWTARGLPGQPTLSSFARGAGNVLLGSAKVAGKVAKVGLQGAGAVMGAGAGLAIGIATGKGVQGAMQGLGVGAAAGFGVGSSAYNIGEGAVKGTYNTGKKAVQAEIKQRKAVRDIKREREIEKIEATEGVEAANKYARNNLTKGTKKRYDQILRDYQIATGYDLTKTSKKSKEELYKDIYDYESHGVSDQDKIVKGLRLEHDKKYEQLRKDTGLENSTDKHDNIVDVMRMTNSYGKQYITNTKNNEEFNKAVDLQVKNQKDRDNLKDLFWEANGFDHLDRRKEEQQKAQEQAKLNESNQKSGNARGSNTRKDNSQRQRRTTTEGTQTDDTQTKAPRTVTTDTSTTRTTRTADTKQSTRRTKPTTVDTSGATVTPDAKQTTNDTKATRTTRTADTKQPTRRTKPTTVDTSGETGKPDAKQTTNDTKATRTTRTADTKQPTRRTKQTKADTTGATVTPDAKQTTIDSQTPKTTGTTGVNQSTKGSNRRKGANKTGTNQNPKNQSNNNTTETTGQTDGNDSSPWFLK